MERQPFLYGFGNGRGAAEREYVVHVEGNALNRHLAGLYLGNVEYVVYDLQQPLRVLQYPMYVRFGLFRYFAVERELGEAYYAVHGRPYLVAHVGEENRLGAVRGFGGFGALLHERLQALSGVAPPFEQNVHEAHDANQQRGDAYQQRLARLHYLHAVVVGLVLPQIGYARQIHQTLRLVDDGAQDALLLVEAYGGLGGVVEQHVYLVAGALHVVCYRKHLILARHDNVDVAALQRAEQVVCVAVHCNLRVFGEPPVEQLVVNRARLHANAHAEHLAYAYVAVVEPRDEREPIEEHGRVGPQKPPGAVARAHKFRDERDLPGLKHFEQLAELGVLAVGDAERDSRERRRLAQNVVRDSLPLLIVRVVERERVVVVLGGVQDGWVLPYILFLLVGEE